jgi:hypothetical protein
MQSTLAETLVGLSSGGGQELVAHFLDESPFLLCTAAVCDPLYTLSNMVENKSTYDLKGLSPDWKPGQRMAIP